MRTALFTLLLAIGAVAVAQESVPELRRSSDAGQRVFDQRGHGADTAGNNGGQKKDTLSIVEEMPSFPGGGTALLKFLQENMVYPKQARDEWISGTVYVSFVVEKDGTISDPRVLRGIGGGCDEEALRAVNAMPVWTPGMRDGEPVRVQYNLPIQFKMR